MTIRRIITLLILAGALAICVSYVRRLIPRLQYNRAVYALNQGKYKEAEQRLGRVSESAPLRDRSAVKLAEALVRQGRYADALEKLRTVAASSGATFWKAVAEYELGNEGVARQLLQGVLTNASLQPDCQSLARTAVAALSTTGSLLEAAEPPDENHKLEYMLWNSWNGRISLSAGKPVRAAQQFETAYALGDRNPQTRTLACVSNVLPGNFSKAQYYLDSSSSATAMLMQTSHTLARLLGERQTTSVVERDVVAQAELLALKQRCDVWLQLQASRRNMPEAATSESLFLQLTDPITQLLHGDLLASKGDYRAAYDQYMAMSRNFPSLQALLRQLELSGQAGELSTQVEEFAAQLPGARWIKAAETTVSVSLSTEGIAVFRTPGSLHAGFQVAEAGAYRACVVASADHAAQLGPVIHSSIDTFSLPSLYVAREGWDCYEVESQLSAGDHLLKLQYDSESAAMSHEGEKRSLYILGILLEPKRPGNR